MELLVIFCCLIYLSRVLIIKFAAKKHRNKINEKKSATVENFPQISVIIPARNEENNIENCINSILKSNYPKNNFEIIIINDRSTDKTPEIIAELAKKSENIKIYNTTTETINPNLRGKPGAIQLGIEKANGNIIMMTDADCTVPQDWILTVANNFQNSNSNNSNINENNSNSNKNNSEENKINSEENKEIGMICSYTNIKSNRIFHYFQAAEWAYMHTYACAGISLDTVLGCFGNNISITKKAYEKIGGFENLAFSVTEDYVLLNAIHKAGFGIKYLCSKNVTVETLPVETFKDYIIQRKRWSIGAIDLGWKAFTYVFSSICLWIAIGISFFIGNYYLLAVSIILRFIGDALILFPIFDILETKYLKKWIPFSVFFYSLIEIILPFTLISGTVKWKDQTFSRKS